MLMSSLHSYEGDFCVKKALGPKSLLKEFLTAAICTAQTLWQHNEQS